MNNTEDAERIVACLNFCREFPTEKLKGLRLRYLNGSEEIVPPSYAQLPGFEGFVAAVMLPVVKDEA